MKVIIDSGASVNIVDATAYQKLKCNITINSSDVKIFANGSSAPLPLKGKFQAKINSNNKDSNHILRNRVTAPQQNLDFFK